MNNRVLHIFPVSAIAWTSRLLLALDAHVVNTDVHAVVSRRLGSSQCVSIRDTFSLLPPLVAGRYGFQELLLVDCRRQVGAQGRLGNVGRVADKPGSRVNAALLQDIARLDLISRGNLLSQPYASGLDGLRHERIVSSAVVGPVDERRSAAVTLG